MQLPVLPFCDLCTESNTMHSLPTSSEHPTIHVTKSKLKSFTRQCKKLLWRQRGSPCFKLFSGLFIYFCYFPPPPTPQWGCL